jgi:hypothetical protein
MVQMEETIDVYGIDGLKNHSRRPHNIKNGKEGTKTRQKVSAMLVHHFVNHVWKYNI